MARVQNGSDAVKTTVIGIGGAGIQIINGMIEQQAEGVEFIGMDTDIQALKLCRAPILLHLETDFTESGTGGDPELGEDSAVHNAVKISDALDGTDMVFILCGLGGGTGTGAACAVTDITKKMGIFTAAIVTSPFYFEEKAHIINAMNGIERLKVNADSIAIIANDKALEIVDWNATIREALNKADDVIRQMVRGIVALVNVSDEVKLNINDVQCAMKSRGGITYIGIGEGSGKDMAIKAALRALQSPWQRSGPHGADRVLLHIAGDINMSDVNDACSCAQSEIGGDAKIILGARHVAGSDVCVVTVIATGSDDSLNVLLCGREGECLRCWFKDTIYSGWRRGWGTWFCGIC